MVWIYTSLLELSKTVENKGSSNNCLMKMWKRKPMFGAAETYPVSGEPRHKVYGAADSQDVIIEMSGEESGRKP
jgi:hypothetical protein